MRSSFGNPLPSGFDFALAYPYRSRSATSGRLWRNGNGMCGFQLYRSTSTVSIPIPRNNASALVGSRNLRTSSTWVLRSRTESPVRVSASTRKRVPSEINFTLRKPPVCNATRNCKRVNQSCSFLIPLSIPLLHLSITPFRLSITLNQSLIIFGNRLSKIGFARLKVTIYCWTCWCAFHTIAAYNQDWTFVPSSLHAT